MSDPKDQIRRILNIIPFVRQHQGVSIEDLARYCGSEPQVILKDLDQILLCGVPPYLPDDYVGVYVDDACVEIRFADHFRRPVRFTPTEALALLLALESLPQGGDEAQLEAKASLTGKIRGILSGTVAKPSARGAEAVEGRIETLTGSAPARGLLPARRLYREALFCLKPAIDAGHEVEIEYYSASQDQTTARAVQPYGLVEQRGDLYLVAHCKRADATRSFRVDRIRRATACPDACFTRPKGFDIARYARRRMNFKKDHRYEARVRVTDERRLRWLQDTRPDQVEECDGATAVVKIRAYELPWLLNEVLSYGPDAEVLDPPEVRAELRAHALAMAERARTVPSG